MREHLRLLFAACCYYSGLVKLLLWWKHRSGRSLTILNYHRAVGEHLQGQMRYLRQQYRVLHLEDALEELYTPEKRSRVRDQRPLLVLTFDDGYLDNYTTAFPLARELRMPITIFLIPGYLDSGACFWWLAGDYLVSHACVDKVTIEGQSYLLAHHSARVALVQVIDRHLRYARSVAERETFLADIQQSLGVTLPTRAAAGMSDPALPMTWAEVREMEESGWVSFGAHTVHHPVLSYLTDPAEVQAEVEEGRHVLEQRLRHPVQTFAYPIGKSEHIGNEGLRAVVAAGYRWAVTTVEQVNTPASDHLLLGRLPGDVEQHWLILAAEQVGLLGILSRLRRKL